MKLTASIIKTLKENLRDWKVLVMVLAFSPFFLLLMYLFYGGGPTTYTLGIINLDSGSKAKDLIHTLENIKGHDNSRLFSVTDISNREQLKTKVREKVIDLGIIIPKDYTEKLTVLASGKNIAIVSFYGSMGNVKYPVAAVYASDLVYKQGMKVAQITLPSKIDETFLEKKQPLNEFEQFVPGLISLAVLMILFSATASIVKENDKLTFIRIKLSRLGAFNFFTGISTVQIVVAVVAIVLSYWTALGLGYKPEGSFGALLAAGIISSIGIVAVVASFLNTVFDVLTIGCFPFFILMFFSGSMFPLPKMNMFTFGGHSFGITDILPLTHTANAFDKILNYGSGIAGVEFELLMISILTVIYFLIGSFLYQKRKLSRA